MRGVTTYNALRNAGLRGGDTVAVRASAASGTWASSSRDAWDSVPLPSAAETTSGSWPASWARTSTSTPRPMTPAAVLQRMGGARAIVATSPSGQAMGSLVSALAAGGKLIVVGVPSDPIQVSAVSLIFGGRSIYGTLTGTAIDSEDTLAFSVLQDIRPMVETAPLERAADAYARMMQGHARFRMVLVTKEGAAREPHRTCPSGVSLPMRHGAEATG